MWIAPVWTPPKLQAFSESPLFCARRSRCRLIGSRTSSTVSGSTSRTLPSSGRPGSPAAVRGTGVTEPVGRHLALVRQHQRTTRVEPLQELPALPGLQPPIRATPWQQLAHGARQLHPAQARTVPHNLADQRHLLHAEGASREPRRRHGHRRGICLPTTPYQTLMSGAPLAPMA